MLKVACNSIYSPITYSMIALGSRYSSSPQHTTFPSDAGLFKSAERGEFWIMVQCIDQNPIARIYLCSHFPHGSLQIGRTNVSQQSIYRVIGHFNGFGFPVLYVMMERTGPNTSSLAMRIFRVTPAKAVGLTKKPSVNPSGCPSPPIQEFWAPSSSADLLYRPCTRYRIALGWPKGRYLFSSFSGSPTF